MTMSISRMQFLRGDFTNRHSPIRPPWACEEHEFVDKCSRCDKCVTHCPEKILTKDKHGYPQVDFSKGECLFCNECVDQCEAEALSQDLITPPWSLRAEVTEKCFVYQGVHCMVCREQCEAEAISFRYRAGLPPTPYIDLQICNGCGACYKLCPGKAINLAYQNNGDDPDKGNVS